MSAGDPVSFQQAFGQGGDSSGVGQAVPMSEAFGGGSSVGQPVPMDEAFGQKSYAGLAQNAGAKEQQYGMLHNLAGSFMANAGNPLANLGIRAAGEVGAISPQTAQQLINTQPFTYDPNALSSKIAGALGQAIPVAASGFAAPATAFASAAEQERERTQPDVTKSLNAGQSVDTLAQGALNAVLTKFMPGQAGSKAVLNAVPEIQNATLGMMRNAAVQSGMSFSEGDAVNAIGNAIRKATGQPGGSSNPLNAENIEAGVTNAAGALPLHVAHALTQSARSADTAPLVDPNQIRALLQPTAGTPDKPSVEAPIQQAGGLNLSALKVMTDHTAGLLEAMKQLSAQQDQQLAAHANPTNVATGKAGIQAEPDAFSLMEQNRAARPPQSRSDSGQETAPVADEKTSTAPLPPILDNAPAKVRMPAGAENPSTEMQFDNPIDKAAYLASNARGGKIAAAAVDYLKGQGFTPNDIAEHSSNVQRVARQNAASGQTVVPDSITPEMLQRTQANLPAVENSGVESLAKVDSTPTGRATNQIAELTSDQINQKIAAQNTGDLDQDATRQLVGNGNYVLKDVPLDQLGPVFGKNGIDQTRVDKYAAMPSEKQPPIVAGNVDGQLRPIDGKHRLMAAIQRGDSTIPAYVPKDGSESPAPPTSGVSPALRRRAGAVQLPDSVTNFVDQDVRPKLDSAVEGIQGSWNSAKNFFGMQSDDSAISAKNTLRNRGAELQQRVDSVRTALTDAKQYFDSQPQTDTRQFIDDVENGRPVANSAEQPVADALRELLDNRRDQLVKRDWLDSFIDNYFPHLWQEQEKASNVFSKSPMAGGSGFLRKRTLPTMQDGLNAGLTPLYENPVEAVMARVHQIDKFITAHDAFDKMQDDGILHQVNATDPVKEGYARINDNIARTFIKPTSKGGLNLAKRFDAPQAVASVINNYTDPGLRNTPGGYVLRAAIGASNVMNSVQLGLSPFHAVFTSSNAILTKMATGARQLMNADIPGAAKSLLTAPVAPMEYYKTGGKLMQEWMKPGSTDAQTAQYVQWLKDAGGRASLDSQYDNGFRASFQKAITSGNPIGAAIRAPLAGLEAVASPIMNHLVPRMKLGAFLDEARQNLEQLPDTATDQDRRSALGNAWDSVDNRFGQLTYDNIFWNRIAKDVGMASTRSLGWNLGTFRELGGGVGDIARGKVNSGRAAYAAMLPVLTGAMAATATKLLFGQQWNPTDPFVIHTGQKDQQGHEITYSPPTYMKDIMGFAKHPVLTVEHKASPALASAIELMNNKDYRGAEIRNPDDSIGTQIGQLGKYTATEMTPFSIANTFRNVGQGGSEKTGIASLMGMTRNPSEWGESKAEQTTHDILAAGGRNADITPEEEQKYQEKSKLLSDMSAASPAERRGLAVQAVHLGTISGTQIPDMLQMAKLGSPLERGIARMVAEGQHGVDDAFKVWDEATPEEQEKIRPLISREINNSRTIPFSQKQIYRARLSGKELQSATQ